MRREPTIAENKLWQFIRDRKVKEARFGRQHTVERFIVDFACVELKLIIEVDGEIHEYTKEENAIRQSYLESAGFKVLRFSDKEIMDEVKSVIKRISITIKHLSLLHSPLGKGHG